MKKFAILALVGASLFGVNSAVAQETTYVEDCTQGLLVNRMQDNWFITVEGGANMFFSSNDVKADFADRIGASVNIYAGKWFTPVWGFRFGVSGNINRGATTASGYFRDIHHGVIATKGNNEPVYSERIGTIGPKVELMLSLTNWLCGYNPNRVYNAVFHGGGGGYWTFYHGTKDNNNRWREADNKTLFAEIGLQNNFAVSKQVDIFLDVSATAMNYTTNENDRGKDRTLSLAVQAGFTYKFKSREWNCPVTAVCPTWKYTDAEGDALVARLANADNKIKDLQRQLDECLNRPKEDCECVNALATVYFPINVSTLSNRDKTLVESMANTIKNTPDKKYILTGWADNYTGTDAINTRLRNERVNTVYNCLVNAGVDASQLETRIDANNLTDFGIKGARFDRAVTIVEAK